MNTGAALNICSPIHFKLYYTQRFGKPFRCKNLVRLPGLAYSCAFIEIDPFFLAC